MGAPEIVVKRAWACSSRFTPVGAPIGRSGDFSSVGASVFSAHVFSAAFGWRLSKTSAIGLSATCGFSGFFSMLAFPINALFLDDREVSAWEQGVRHHNDRSVCTHTFSVAVILSEVGSSRMRTSHAVEGSLCLRLE